MPLEEWRPVVGFEGLYEVSNLGRVKSLNYNGTKTEKVMSPVLARGYPRACLQNGSGRKYLSVHRMVAAAFIGECPAGHQVNHINAVKTDSRLSNLEYVTPSENRKHSFRIGTESMKGENHTRHRLTNENVIDIRERLMNGERQADIAATYDIDKSAISRINTGARWAHVAFSEKAG